MIIRLFAAIAGGLAMWLANEPVGWWFLAFVGVALLWLTVRNRGVAAGFGLAWVWGFAFFLPLFHWATTSTGTFLAQFALAAVEAVYIGVLGSVWALISRIGRLELKGHASLGLQIAMAVVTWLAMEQLKSSWPFGGMPWGTLGFAFVDSPLVRLAPYGSTALVGGVAIVVGLLAAMLFRMTFLGASAAVLSIMGLVLVPVFVPIGGQPTRTMNVAIVQGNIPEPGTENRALAVTQNHVDATRELLEESMLKPEMILWPESSSDRDVRLDGKAGEMVFGLVNEVGIPLVMGTQEYISEGRYNDVLVIEPGVGVTDRYTKQHPVPFGEYMPYRDFFRNFTDAVDLVSIDMLAGEGKANVVVPADGTQINLAVPICFEVAYSEIVADAVANGAELIVIPTNNASFEDSGLSPQQFAMSKFRAVEHARTVVQVSTSGITGVVNSYGQVAYETDMFTRDARIVQLGLHDAVTIASLTLPVRVVAIYILGSASAIVAVAVAISTRDRGRA